MHRTTSTSSGYTLTELLLALTILAVLAAILMPVLRESRIRSHRIACQSNLRQLYIAGRLYSDNHEVSLPPVENKWAQRLESQVLPQLHEKQQRENIRSLPSLLAPYVRSMAVFNCPADTGIVFPQDLLYVPRSETMHERFGTSYRQISEDSYSMFEVPDEGSHSRIPYIADASGYWHPGPAGSSGRFGRINMAIWRVNVIYLDGHSRSVGFRELFSTPYVEFLRDEY